MEPQAPSRSTDGAGIWSAALDFRARILVPLALVAWLALAVIAASAVGAPPQPDAVPQAPAVAPDPAPGAADSTPAPAEQPPAEPRPSVPAPTRQPTSAEPEAARGDSKPRPAGKRRRASAQRREGSGRVAAAQAASLLRIKSLLPEGQTAGESSPRLVLLAAGALLALVLASGSMLSVSSRVMKGELR